ncbi:lipocalin family protein [Chitinophaga rhizosphaerae]|uniref:lipocalin family protein n=1 Tax=Chitinophaga rhizosphaerae TaxID=1864947 RepID=UPI000F8155C8|nr:lipocalin family protein [Chitinophaga rhizosphaerae]
MTRILLPAILLLAAACNNGEGEAHKDSVAVTGSDTIFIERPLEPAVALDPVHIDSSILPGRWVQPAEGVDTLLLGFQLKKGGKASSIQLESLKYQSWSLRNDTLLLHGLAGYSKADTTFLQTDTLLIRELSDTALRVHPVNAAEGHIETFKRQTPSSSKKRR